MKISIRIVLLVLLGFLTTLSVAGIAVVSMSRMASEIGRLGNQAMPLIGTLTSVSVTQLESAAALERALRAGIAPDFPGADQDAIFSGASARYGDLAAETQDRLRTAIVQTTEALRVETDETTRASLRTILGMLHEIGLTLGLHTGVAQRVLFLLEEGRRDEAIAGFDVLSQRQAEMTDNVSALIQQIETLARQSTETASRHQQSYLWFMVAAAIVGLMACLVLGWLIGQSVAHPIRAVTGALAELVRGNTETPLDIPGSQSETGAMGVALRAFRDEIIDRRKTVTALAESERRFHALAELAPVGVFYADPNGNTTYVNEKGCEVVGLSVIECLGQGWTRGVHPDDLDEIRVNWQYSITHHQPHRGEFRLVKPDGTVTWVIGEVTPSWDVDGQVGGFVGTITDISEQKAAEARLVEHAQSRSQLHEITADQSLSLDEKMNRLLALGTETFRLPLGIISRISGETYTIRYISGPEGAPPAGTVFNLGETYCAHTLEANGPIGFHNAGESRIADHPCYLKFGLESYIGSPLIVDGQRFGTLNFSSPEARAQPFGDADFSLIQLFAQWIGNEISRQRAEDTLRESEERMRSILDNVVDGIITIDEQGIIKSVNPAIERIFRYSRDELLGRNVRMLMTAPHRESHDGYLKRYLESGEAHIIGKGREVEGLRRDGTVFPMDLAVSEMVRDDGFLFTGVIRDITERKQVERMKSEFVSSVSHELRTPLTSIRGALGLIVGTMGDTLDGKVRDLVEIAFNNSQRLINLVNDILDLEKIGSGRMEFRLEPTDLVALVRKAIAENKGLADEYGVAFKLTDSPSAAWVRADDDRIGQVMANLLSNAAKFSPKGGTVDVSVVRYDGTARISVTDRGPGIPEEFQPRIFERFSQADSSDARKVGGTGLGLSIVKAIVDYHRGEIGFETEVGSGTTFHVDLPAAREQRVAGGAAAAPEPAEPTVPKAGHILICEDDPDIAKLLAVLLEQNGLTSDIAYTAKEAKALLRKNRYDAMTVDILLPGQDGISLVRDIRRGRRTRDLPVVVISARAETARDELEGTALDIVDWLNKPIDEKHLQRALVLATGGMPAEKPRLLYVEDDPDLVEIVTALVGKTARTTVAGSLAEARAKLKRGRFDLVILDVLLPDGSGLDLLESLRDENGQPTPVIIFSGAEIEGELAQQVDAALVKSRTSDIQLLETIRRLIATRSSDPDGREP